MNDFLRHRKQDRIEADEVRRFVVKVRFNPAELAVLDTARGRFSRAEVLRFLLLNKMPPAVPPINRDAWIDLARTSANLNQIAHHLNAGESVDVVQVLAALQSFRDTLIGAQR